MVAMPIWFRFVLAILATWRLTHLLASEDGPADLIARIRARLGEGIVGQLMDCFNCLSFWIAAPAAVFVTRNLLDWVLVWVALSGGACLLERLGHEPLVIEPASELEEGESRHVLRPQAVGFTERNKSSPLQDSARDNF